MHSQPISDIQPLADIILLLGEKVSKLITECRDFYKLEEEVYKLSQEACVKIFAWALEEIDTWLVNARDKRTWKVIGFRERTVVSSFGEFKVKRRLYRNKKTGEARFLLDEVLGWPERSRCTPRLKEMAVKLGSEVPFRRAAEILGYFVPGISAMAVWQAVQEAGEALRQEGESRREAVFEKGETPEGKEKTSRLYIEADGVVVRLQRSGEKRKEVKLFVAYTGKEAIGGGRKALKDKLVTSGVGEGERMWEEVYSGVASRWDMGQVKEIYLGSDGAEWAKQGVDYFPGAVHVLDPYHLNRRLIEAFWHDEEAYSRIRQAIYLGDWEKVEEILGGVARRVRGAKRRRIEKLWQYLKENWSGIVTSSAAEHLGAIEGQVQHNVARRMKRLGASWTEAGADRMARVLAARANGVLGRHTSRWPVLLARQEHLAQAVRLEVKRKIEEAGSWHKAGLPALRGPSAGAPWVKHVLRELSRPSLSSLIP
ncbi:ISLre2 family transposase [Desulfothermobacter acidiphilus]|uniref:ISLre2 family transposase n=1 Tax=Desulfothermobacter acidiphilus TaxID=1938353 RepID=UPI003F8BF98A